MPYKENLKKATELKKELDRFRPLTPEVENRIMQKFRLDWNYHSSHIEGNQLTYGETKALILFGQTAQAKPLKDHLEMTGHDEAIKNIEEVVKQKRPLTEHFIRELHELILKAPYKVKAKTPDGKPTERTISIGQYKTVPNHVQTVTNEIFYFASPEETPALMGELMQWYNDNKEKMTFLHPVLFATEFHYRFIRIHPFDDGNGRIGRLLMNFILMQKGYPPAIIKTEDKANYYAALQQADSGQLEYFFNYVCEQVNYSLELMIKAAKGQSIEEDDDLDKKIALLEKELEAEDEVNDIQTKLSYGALNQQLNTWLFDLINGLIITTNKFSSFYLSSNHYLDFQISNQNKNFYLNESDALDKFKKYWEELYSLSRYTITQNCELKFAVRFTGYKKGGVEPFDCNYNLEIKYEQYRYEIFIDQFDLISNSKITNSFAKRLLHKYLLPEEIKEINKQWGETLYNHLEYYRKRKNGNDKI